MQAQARCRAAQKIGAAIPNPWEHRSAVFIGMLLVWYVTHRSRDSWRSLVVRGWLFVDRGVRPVVRGSLNVVRGVRPVVRGSWVVVHRGRDS
jgi:hypothetical protein